MAGCGPEIARLIEEFEGVDNTDTDFIDRYHVSSASTQLQFYEDVKQFLLALEEAGNAFKDDSSDLYDLETKLVAPIDSEENINNIQKIGTTQLNKFTKNRWWERKIPISDTIKKNKLHIFSTSTRVPSKKDQQVKSAFSRLFIACQTREGNLGSVFCP